MAFKSIWTYKLDTVNVLYAGQRQYEKRVFTKSLQQRNTLKITNVQL